MLRLDHAAALAIAAVALGCAAEEEAPARTPTPATAAGEEDDAPPAFRSSLNCDPGYPVVFIDHYNRENRGSEERWHNPPPWAPAVIWQFFSTLRDGRDALRAPAP
jgi:hypothetical protein